eukprot:CAMPEP_0119503804 /NCGR_PEP_ID=MMETSP1344-20130328/24860_1 /TAXON_ID=236787 /ORGANISM="Florenciella parvula, Strain CCMP2471" /LENGTH=367 /DNA_ID=CAMNT_0007540129 /DNA_START=6 /DNA_END=1105 /DNA_ORIENTATION=-
MKENVKGVVDHEHGGNIIHNPHDRMVVNRIMSHVHATFDAKEAALTNAVTAHDILSVRYSHALMEIEDQAEAINELEGSLKDERALGAKTKKVLKSKIADQADVNMRIMSNAKKLRRNQLKDTRVHGSRISTLQEQLNQRNEELAKTTDQLDMALEDNGHQEAHFRKYVELKKSHAKLKVLHAMNKTRLGRTVESLSKAEGGLRKANEMLMKLESNAITHRRQVAESRKASTEALEQYSDLYGKFEAMFDKTEAATQTPHKYLTSRAQQSDLSWVKGVLHSHMEKDESEKVFGKEEVMVVARGRLPSHPEIRAGDRATSPIEELGSEHGIADGRAGSGSENGNDPAIDFGDSGANATGEGVGSRLVR